MRLLIALVLALSLPFSALADKKGDLEQQTGSGPSTPTPGGTSHVPRVDPTTRFIESNTIETLYHELAHALIDILDLPVFGPEEFAADLFSVILMDRLHDEDTSMRLAYDVAAAYEADADMDESLGHRPAMWDVHGSNQQRYFNLVCLFYGAKPNQRDEMAEDLGLPEERAETCAEEFDQANRSWGDVLDGLTANAPGTSIKMDWILDHESHLTVFVKGEVDRLNNLYALPQEMTVSVIPCGEVNAFYDPDSREIIICTELADHLAKLAP